MESIDLFEHYDILPKEMIDILDRYSDLFVILETDRYILCRQMLNETELIGYTFNYGLDGDPCELTKIEN